VRGRSADPGRAIALGLVLAMVGGVLAFAIYQSATKERRDLDRLFGPGLKVLVAHGELLGKEWRIYAYDEQSRQCLVAADLLFANKRCFFPGSVPGAPVDFALWSGPPGSTRYSAIVGGVSPEVARAVLMIGDRTFDLRTIRARGFDLRFIVRVFPGELGPARPGSVVAYDSRGRQL
jgi:hypothetical protein